MAEIDEFDTIEYLFHRRHPIGNGLFAGWIEVNPFSPPSQDEIIRCNQAMEDYRKELSLKTPAEIDELVRAEKEKEKRQAADERRRFFNQPSARADFDYYRKAPCWGLEECVALSFGREPKQVNWTTVRPSTCNSPFAQAYARLRDLAGRAKRVGQLTDPVSPSTYLTWAIAHNISVPDEFVSNGFNSRCCPNGLHAFWGNHGTQFADPLHQSDAASEETRAALSEPPSQSRELHRAQSTSQVNLLGSQFSKPLSTKKRESMLKLVATMAIRGYGFNPLQLRNAATKDIQDDIQALGLSMDGDTVRKYLKQGSDLVPRDALDSMISEPNSAKR